MNKLFDYIKEHKPQTYAVCGGIIVIILLLLICIPKKDNNVNNSNTVTETVTDTANAGPDAINVSTLEKEIKDENIKDEKVETKNNEINSELKNDNVTQVNDDSEISTSTNNENVSTSTGGTYPSGLRKPGVTPIDPSIGNYHGYDGSPKLDSETLKKAAYDDSSYTGYKHITWTASNGVVLWLVDDPYLSDGRISRHQNSIYDSPTAEPGTPESDAVEEFCFGADENSSERNEATYQDILKHKDDIKDIPETSVRPDFTNASGCMEAYRSEEMMNFRRANGKANAAERGALWYSSDENKIWAIFDIETNGKDVFWQTENLNAKAWQLRWWEDDGTGTSSWQIQIYQNLSDIEWNSLKTMLKTCVAGPAYNDIYNRLYNSFYNRPDISGIEEFNTQYTFDGYNISCEYIEPEYGYVEYWIWP